MSWNNTPPPSYSAPAPPGTGNSGSLYSFTSPPTHDSPPIYSANTTTSSLYSSNPQSSLYTQPASSSSLYTSSGPTSPLYSSGSNSSLLPPTGNPTLRGKTSPQPTVRLQRPGTGIPPPTEAAPHPPNGGTGQGPYRSISGPNRGGPGPNRGGPPTHGTPNKPLPKPPGSLDPDSVSAPVISLEKDELPISQQTPDKNRFRSNWAPPVPSPRHSYIGAPGAVSAPHLDETADSSEDEEEEEEEEFSDESDSHSQQSTTSSTASNKSGLLKFSRANKKTPAYLLASGPPRVCDGCMALIYCSEIPFPDGKKPKSKKLKQLTAQESQKAKLKKEQEKEKKKLIKEQTREIKKAEKEKKKSTSDLHSEPEASYEPAAVPNHDDLPPPTKEELEEVTIDDLIEMQISDKINQEIAERDNLKVELAACEDINSPEYAKLKEALEEKEYVIKALFSTLGMENQSTEFNPLLRRKDYRKRKRNITIVRSTVLTGGAMSISAVGGAVVGGVTGFLFGFGVPGAIAGAAIGAGIGGAGGAVVGGYASRQAATQRPKHCLNCRVVMKKNKPGRMPYKCRSCWMWYCDRCVPHELVLENETIHTIIYKDDSDTVTRYDPSEVHEEVPFASEYQRSARQGSKSVLKKRKSSLFSSSKPTSADEVSKAVPEREAWCSWCFKKTIHLFVSKGHITRNVWQCEHCLNRTLKCRNPACEEMARGLLGYDEEACWKCQRKIHSWEDGSLENDAKVKNSYCSWCFDFTQHEPMCHTSVIRIYKCRACRNTTVPCSSCPRGDGWGMARDNGFFWKGKCALHAKHIETWEDPQHNRDISEIRGVWCPWCMELSTHVVMGPGGLLNRKTAFLCKNCHQRTYKCSDSECNFAMAIHARRKCLPCKIKQKQEKNPNEIIPSFDELLEKKNTVYEDLSSLAIRKRDLRRESAHEERQNATKEGYLRPFLLLVSMEPPMRVLTAATLGIDLIRRPIFGDSHAEAWLIISHHNKGLIFRTRVASEEVTKLATGTKATWYTTLRRAMRATMKSTTFKHINAKISKDACMNPDINILPEMELEFLEKLAHWQHMMISPEVAAVADDVMKNPELDQRMAVLDRYGLATPVIKRLLAEMFAESTFATETDMLSQFLAENEKQETPGRKLDDDQISVSTTTTISTMKTSVHGSNSTYSKKSKVVNYTAAAIPAAYVKLTVWFLVGSALAFWLGPVGWAIEWGASLALGAVITAWVAGELYLGPSHEAMTPAVVLICMQRLTLAGEEVDITEFMDKVPPKDERRNSVHKK